MLSLNIEEKLITTVKKLNSLRAVRREAVEVWITDEVQDKKILPTECTSWKRFSEPYTLFRQEQYYWFKAKFDVQSFNENTEKAFLCIETFIDGVACTIRPQGLLYLNGKLIQGIDINHTDVRLQKGSYEMYLLFYTHTFIRSLPVHFSLKYTDMRVEKAYYDFYAPLEAMQLLDKKSDEYVFSATALERAVNLIDFRKDYSETFYASLQAAEAYLEKHYYDTLCGSGKTVNCIGHTHIDVAWLWTLAQTQEKIERSFSTVLTLMDEYPEYKFMSSQPQLYAYLKARNPELYARVKEKIAEGRWEADGAMWLEADCNLTSGESLVRQILYGKKFFREEFGKECTVVWEPDVFGYSAALPQIMKKSGIDKFITAKIGLNDTNRMPYDTFMWQGIDGSSVLAYLISTCNSNPRNGVYDENETTYVGSLTAGQVLGTWNRYQPKEYNDVTITTYGWGDGGGGPTREMLEMQRRFAYGLPGLPKTKISTLEESLSEIETNFRRNAAELKRMPKWNGEIYFEYHRGTYTSVAKNKKNNRRGEFTLQNGELIGTIGETLRNIAYPTAETAEDWKILLLNQFHDILPGSAIREVYEESDRQYKALFTRQNALAEERLNAIASAVYTDGGVFVFNPNGFETTGTISINGVTRVVSAPSTGYAVVRLTDRKAVSVANGCIENEFYRLTLDETGAIVSLWDKRFSRELVQTGERMNVLCAYEDMPYQYDNWELAPYYKQKEWRLDGRAELEAIYDGDRAGYSITKRYFDSVIRQKLFLYSGLERIDFITNVEWREKQQILKARFPFNLLIDKATYDTNVVRFTTFLYQFTLIFNNLGKEKYVEWFGYAQTANPLLIEGFAKESGIILTAEDFVDSGYYNNAFRSPTEKFKRYMDYVERFVSNIVRELVDICHEYGKEAMMFLGDDWIGSEPYGEHFKHMGLDAVVGSVGGGVTVRMLSEIPHVKYHEGRFLPYFFPDTFFDGNEENAVEELNRNWRTARRAMLRKPLDRMGFGGYLSLAAKFPSFVNRVSEIADEFREIYDTLDNKKPYAALKVGLLNAWGKKRSWMSHMVAHELWYQQIYSYQGILEAISGLPVNMEFLSFDDVKCGVPKDIDVIINAGDAYTSYSGGKEWLNENLQASIREFVYNGGGFIGVGEPTACLANGRYFQLADVLGVDEEIGLTLSADKYNIQKVTHEITEGFQKIDYGEDKKNIYALEGTQVLDIAVFDRFKRNVNIGEVKMAVHEYGNML